MSNFETLLTKRRDNQHCVCREYLPRPNNGIFFLLRPKITDRRVSIQHALLVYINICVSVNKGADDCGFNCIEPSIYFKTKFFYFAHIFDEKRSKQALCIVRFWVAVAMHSICGVAAESLAILPDNAMYKECILH